MCGQPLPTHPPPSTSHVTAAHSAPQPNMITQLPYQHCGTPPRTLPLGCTPAPSPVTTAGTLFPSPTKSFEFTSTTGARVGAAVLLPSIVAIWYCW
jgi:hypothetical protein